MQKILIVEDDEKLNDGIRLALRDEMRAFVDRERSRLCGSLGTVRRMAFLYLWGRPDGEKNGEKSSKKRP